MMRRKYILLIIAFVFLVSVIAYMIANKDRVIVEHLSDPDYPDVPDNILQLPEPLRTKAIQDFMNSPAGLRPRVDRLEKNLKDLVTKSQAQAADAEEAKRKLQAVQ
jgi:hypothetical protein